MMRVAVVLKASQRGAIMSDVRVKTLSEAETVLPKEELENFKASLRGSLILPVDAFYEAYRKVWNGMIDKRPGLIVRCQGATDVILCVNFAREHGILLAVRGGGHNVAGNAVCDGGMVVDLSEMRSVRVDVKKNAAYIEGGAVLGDVDRETFIHGLATPTGVVTETGYAGLTLHGGMGWQLRKRGLAADSMIEAEIVTADGALRRANVDENADLFWALRGGGGNFGVVTSFVSRLYPVPRELLPSLFPCFPSTTQRVFSDSHAIIWSMRRTSLWCWARSGPRPISRLFRKKIVAATYSFCWAAISGPLRRPKRC
jgi:hypothetical protein